MKLLTLNVDNDSFLNQINDMVDGKGREVLFVDWIPTTGHVSNEITNQINIMESLPENVRIIIFDRHRSMTDDEITFFVNRENTVLTEPSLMTRPFFLFMPYYIEMVDLPLSTWDNERPFHTGVKGDVLEVSSERYLLNASIHSMKNDENIRIGVSIKNRIRSDKYDILKEVMTFGRFGWSKYNTTIVSQNDDDRYNGVLPDISNHLKYGVVPLVDYKCQWFHAVFKNFIVYDYRDVVWYKKMFKTCNYGFIDELYKNIREFLPQMIIENYIDMLISIGND